MRIHNCHDSSLSNFNQKLRISSFCLGTISTPSISGPLQHILFLPWNPQLIFRDDQKAFIMAPATRLFHQISITASYSIHRKPEYLIINPSKIHHPIQPSLHGFFISISSKYYESWFLPSVIFFCRFLMLPCTRHHHHLHYILLHFLLFLS